jgi:hypothetical protein
VGCLELLALVVVVRHRDDRNVEAGAAKGKFRLTVAAGPYILDRYMKPVPIGVAGGRLEPLVGAQGFTVVMDCGASSASQIRTTLYFGLARPKGSVTELEWQIFLRDEVTRRFPDGLTVWEAEGQWRTPAGSIDHEHLAAGTVQLAHAVERFDHAREVVALLVGRQADQEAGSRGHRLILAVKGPACSGS